MKQKKNNVICNKSFDMCLMFLMPSNNAIFLPTEVINKNTTFFQAIMSVKLSTKYRSQGALNTFDP